MIPVSVIIFFLTCKSESLRLEITGIEDSLFRQCMGSLNIRWWYDLLDGPGFYGEIKTDAFSKTEAGVFDEAKTSVTGEFGERALTITFSFSLGPCSVNQHYSICVENFLCYLPILLFCICPSITKFIQQFLCCTIFRWIIGTKTITFVWSIKKNHWTHIRQFHCTCQILKNNRDFHHRVKFCFY